ncbi:MAG: mechanosensitive ion channel domain-containing protein [Pseudomonadota bacterium]
MLVLLCAWYGARLVERVIQRMARRRATEGGDYSVAYAFGRLMRYVIWFGGTVIALQVAGLNLSSFALVGGAIGVGVGFGLQHIVSNFFSGIILLIERSLKVGDFVDLQSGVRGHVREIALRFTRVTTNDQVDVLVPNSEFVNGRVVNWTFDDSNRRIRIPFGVAYGTDKERVREAGLAAAARIEGILSEVSRRGPEVWLVGFGDSSLTFELVVWVDRKRLMSPARTQASLLWALHDELTARGIEIPFPQRDLHVRSGVLEVLVKNSTTDVKPRE